MITEAGRKLQEELGYFGEHAASVCSLLHRHAVTYTKIQERWCGEEMNHAKREALEAKEARLEAAIRALVADMPCLTAVRFTGDPRGFCVKVFRTDGNHNTWGGKEEGWGVA